MILPLKEALCQAICDGALIITATRRLAKQWQAIVINEQLSPCLKIIAQKDWLNELWTQLEACGVIGAHYLLTPNQEQLLWKKIIESSTQGERLLRIQATAKSVASAAALLKQWQIPLETLKDAGNEETQLFLKWATEFACQQNQHKHVTQSELPDRLLEQGPALFACLSAYSATKKIRLLGFEDIAPQLQAFYTDLRLQGWDIAEINNTAQTHVQHYNYAFYDQAAELRAAALWAQSLSVPGTHPGAIGIVVPDLADCRARVEQIFTEVLEPLSELQCAQEVSPQFNISVAPALATYPIIFAALKSFVLLESAKININDMLFLIKTPFLKIFDLDMIACAEYGDRLRKTEQEVFSLKALIDIAQMDCSPDFADVGTIPRASLISELVQTLPSKASLTHWASVFDGFLKLIAWPGYRVLNSIEHQAMGRFQLLFEEFASLDKVLAPQDLQSAIRLLNGLAAELPFQGQSKPVPIHIMGILEASSQPFEYLWVTGLHNEAWPPIPKANPFLPLYLQRQHQMPHASSEREYYFAQKSTENLKKACGTVVFSYFENDTIKSYSPSALISDIPKTQFNPVAQSDKSISVSEFLFNGNLILDSITDEQAPVIQEAQAYKGGAGLIQAQAACPFKAFVQYRLHAGPRYIPTPGLNARQRGIIVHDILEQVWGVLKTHQALCVLPEEALDNLLVKIINEQVQNIIWAHPDLSDSFWVVERWRLNLIIRAWLKLEKERAPFRVVAQESKATITLAGLPLNLRFDRVDCTQDDEVIIIDYKTSAQTISDTLQNTEGRPVNPQLLLYCLSDSSQIAHLGIPAGVAFGQLQAHACQFVGLSESDMMIPGVKPVEDWKGLLAQWRERLEAIALEFKNGQASVSPYQGEKTCRTCHLAPVCRHQHES